MIASASGGGRHGGGGQRSAHSAIANLAVVFQTSQSFSDRLSEKSLDKRKRENQTSTRKSGRSPPRVAKGVSSIRTVVALDNFPSKKGPMRYKIVPGMPFRQKLWMMLDDSSYVDREAACRLLRYGASYWAATSVTMIALSTLTFALETEMSCTLMAGGSYGQPYITADNCAAFEFTWFLVEVTSVAIFTLEVGRACRTCRDALTPEPCVSPVLPSPSLRSPSPLHNPRSSSCASSPCLRRRGSSGKGSRGSTSWPSPPLAWNSSSSLVV